MARLTFAVCFFLALLSQTATLTFTGKLCKGKGHSSITPIPSHNYCKQRHMNSGLSGEKIKTFVIKHSFVKPEAKACLCTAAKLSKRCDSWFWGSWEITKYSEVVRPTVMQCRDACREMRHRDVPVYSNSTTFEVGCIWMQTTIESRIIVQAEEVSAIEDTMQNTLTFPGLFKGQCQLPIKQNGFCVGLKIMLLFLDGYQPSDCPHEMYNLGICYRTPISQKVQGERLMRLYCPDSYVVDYYRPSKRSSSCSREPPLSSIPMVLTEGNLVLVFGAGEVSNTTRITTSTIKGTTLSASWVMNSNTDLMNQMSMKIRSDTVNMLDLVIEGFERQLCNNWKALLIQSDALLDTSPIKAAEVLVGEHSTYKVSRIMNSIYWTPCSVVEFSFLPDNPKCYKNWPVQLADGNKMYFDPLSHELTSVTSSIPCEQLETYYVKLDDKSYIDVRTMNRTEAPIIDDHIVELIDEQIISAPSLYNLTDHEAITSYDLVSGMIVEAINGEGGEWIQSTWVDAEKNTTIKPYYGEISGFSGFLERWLPSWLYNAGSICITVIEVGVCLYVTILLWPIIKPILSTIWNVIKKPCKRKEKDTGRSRLRDIIDARRMADDIERSRVASNKIGGQNLLLHSAEALFENENVSHRLRKPPLAPPPPIPTENVYLMPVEVVTGQSPTKVDSGAIQQPVIFMPR